MAKNTIKLKKYLDIIEEYQAAGTITPGMLLEFDSDGKVVAHSEEAGNAIPMFALEDEMQGNGIDDNYSSDDQVQVWVAQRGEQVYGLLADDETVVIGDYLVSDGNGRLKKFDSSSSASAIEPNQIVAQALEAVDLDSSGTYPESMTDYDGYRIKVRIV